MRGIISAEIVRAGKEAAMMKRSMLPVLLALALASLSGCGGTILTGEAYCGDEECTPGETCESCPEDCGECPPECGDLECNGEETCATCVADCGECPPVCGDLECNGEETCGTCEADCGECPSVCGAGGCEEDEACDTCPLDCGFCPSVCGAGGCEEDETCWDCAVDCGPCPSFCGDGYCDHDESCLTCELDCDPCPPGCGNGVCDPMGGETCANCPGDCLCGDDTCRDIQECALTCAFDRACMNTCIERGCYEAQPEAVNYLVCLDGHCRDQCADPATAVCLGCAMLFCPIENIRCMNGLCGPRDCGDGTCQPEEDCTSCPTDCGDCPDLCGDGTCQLFEDCNTCTEDCGPCYWCGDGYCDVEEDCSTCPEDCGRCPLLCGDGLCEQLLLETCSGCPADCVCGDAACGGIMACMFACTDIFCTNDCLGSGCRDAQTQAHDLLGCMLTSCIMDCIDPSSSTCQSCLMTSCSTQILLCVTGTC